MPLAVLRLLRPDAFRSGEEISRRLGLSRASVHNAVMRARELGAEIHAVRGQGYRLAWPCTWLDAERLQTALGKRGFSIAVHDQVDSTNSRLLALSQEGAAHKTVLAAEWQSGGRGRRGRTWHCRTMSSAGAPAQSVGTMSLPATTWPSDLGTAKARASPLPKGPGPRT